MDAFEDEPLTTQFNGKPSAIIQVFEVGDQSPLEISKKVAKYVEEAKPSLPPGVELIVARDGSFYLKGRLNMLIQKRGIIGLDISPHRPDPLSKALIGRMGNPGNPHFLPWRLHYAPFRRCIHQPHLTLWIHYGPRYCGRRCDCCRGKRVLQLPKKWTQCRVFDRRSTSCSNTCDLCRNDHSRCFLSLFYSYRDF